MVSGVANHRTAFVIERIEPVQLIQSLPETALDGGNANSKIDTGQEGKFRARLGKDGLASS